jgi:hypothetical protein
MICVFVAYDHAVDEEVIDILEGLNVPGYTKWNEVEGSGGRGRHLGTPVWPNLNNAMLTILDDDATVTKLVASFAELKKRVPGAALSAFVLGDAKALDLSGDTPKPSHPRRRTS